MADVNTSGSNNAGTNNPVQQQNPAQGNLDQQNKPVVNPVTPTTQAQPAEDLGKLFNANTADQMPGLEDQESALTGLARSGLSIAELLSATPLLLSSFVSQAENIIDHEEKELGSFWLNYTTTTIKTLASFFIYPFRKFIAPRQFAAPGEEDVTKVSMNKRPFLLDDIMPRTSQTVFVREVTSFLFSLRRSLFEFFPSLFTVPSEEHDPDNPQGKRASTLMKNIFALGDTALSPFRFISSLIGVAISLPAHILGASSAYIGEQKTFNLAKYGAEISDIIMPVITNLNSLQRTAKAYFDSWSTGNSLRVELDKYNIGIGQLIQAVFGSITAVPHFVSSLGKIKEKILETENGQPRLALLARDFVSSTSLLLKSFGLYSGNTANLQARAYKFADKIQTYIRDYTDLYLGKLMNSNSMLKSFFKKFRPTNLDGEVLTGVNDNLAHTDMRDGYVFNRFKKSTFFRDIYDYLHPIQRTLMLLPNAFVDLSDPYVRDNGTRVLRWLDRLVGLNSMILSFPNAVIYFAKTRAPQLILKFYETRQKRKELEGQSYSSYLSYMNFVDKLHKSNIPGAGYIAATLDTLDIRPDDFKNPEVIKAKLETIEDDAKQQEHSVKASELVKAMRIGMRHLIATENPIFFARRDAEGYTAEEQSKMKVYDSIGNLATTIRGIPIIGWFGAPLIEMFRSMYKVKRKENLKLLGSRPGAKEEAPVLSPAREPQAATAA